MGLVEKLAELKTDGTNRAFICHADCEADAKAVAEKIKEQTGLSDILIAPMGPIIGLHAGPGTVALFFMGRER